MKLCLGYIEEFQHWIMSKLKLSYTDKRLFVDYYDGSDGIQANRRDLFGS